VIKLIPISKNNTLMKKDKLSNVFLRSLSHNRPKLIRECITAIPRVHNDLVRTSLNSPTKTVITATVAAIIRLPIKMNRKNFLKSEYFIMIISLIFL
jgi:hypothetical protein